MKKSLLTLLKNLSLKKFTQNMPALRFMTSQRSMHILSFLLIFSAALVLTACTSTDFGDEESYDSLDEIDFFMPHSFRRHSRHRQMEDAIEKSLYSIVEATESFTPEFEYHIGRTVAASLLRKYPLYDDEPEKTAYLNKICSAMTINSEVPYLYHGYRVAILDTPEINAMSTPSGHIFISRGMLDCTKSEDAVAAVLAHEIAHIQLKHSIQAIRTSRISKATLNTLTAAQMVYYDGKRSSDDSFANYIGSTVSMEVLGVLNDIQGEIVDTLISSGFSQAQELEADKKALQLMNDAGYDPSEMINVLELIRDANEENRNRKLEDFGWLKTHPDPKLRIKKTNKQLSRTVIRCRGKEIRRRRFEIYFEFTE